MQRLSSGNAELLKSAAMLYSMCPDGHWSETRQSAGPVRFERYCRSESGLCTEPFGVLILGGGAVQTNTKTSQNETTVRCLVEVVGRGAAVPAWHKPPLSGRENGRPHEGA